MTQTSSHTLADDAAITADAWTQTLHHPTLPSGARVVYRDVSLFDLERLDALSSELRELVIREWAHPGTLADLAAAPFKELPDKPTRKQQEKADQASLAVIDRIGEVNLHLVALALVEPQMTVEELRRIPTPDLEMLSGLINRKIAHDAVGRRVGVVPLDWFRVVTAAHGVECAPDCRACQEAGWTLSTVHR